MARPIKKGLNYYSMDVDFFQDIKIKKILRSNGLRGIAVLIYLLCNIYRIEGYYMRWNEDVRFLVSDELGIKDTLVQEAVLNALNVGFFNKDIFEKYGVLTSKGIQDRYLEGTYRRKDIKISEKLKCTDNDD